MSKSQLEKLFEHASDAFISKMYDVPIHQIQNRRSDYDIKQFKNTLNRMEREDETVPLNSEKEFLYMKATGIVRRIEECVIIGQKLKKPHKHRGFR